MRAKPLIHTLALPAANYRASKPLSSRWEQVNRQVQSLYAELKEQSTRLTAQFSGRLVANTKKADERYQTFMLQKVDPLFGSERNRSLAEMAMGEIEISDKEKQLNRYLAASVTTLGLTGAAHVVGPLLFIPAIGTALYSTMLILQHTYNALFIKRRLRSSVLGSLTLIGAWAGGYFGAGSITLITYYFSQKMILIAQDRSKKGLIEVFNQQPRTVWQLIDGVEVEVPFASLKAGDIVVMHAGQVVAVDGVVVHGVAMIDQQRLTGEAQPVEKSSGDSVLAATLLLTGMIQVRVEKTGAETVATQVGAILNKTASYQAGIISKGEQFADNSVLPVMSLAALALPLAGYQYALAILGAGIGTNIKITAPIAMLNFLNLAAKQSILFKDGRSLELLKEVDTVVFDKTGTLTLEQPMVGTLHTSAGYSAENLLIYAAAAEHRQTHPIARAILAAAAERGLAVPVVDHAEYRIGYGIRVTVGAQTICVGSERYLQSEGIAIPAAMQALQAAAQNQGHSFVLVAVDEQLAGGIELQPTLRPEAKAVIQTLRQRNLQLYIISGDNEQPTRKLADELGIPHFFANTLPEHKALLVEQLQQAGHAVCFIGDGINDSIALKKANVSISLRGASSAATDSAQIILMQQSLQQVPYLFELAQRFDSNMKAGFATAIGQGAITITGAMFGQIGILAGTLIWQTGLFAGLGIAALPLLQKEVSGR